MNDIPVATRDRYDFGAFAATLGDVPVSDNPKTLATKSRDFFWFSPVLKRQLQGKVADLIVSPRDESDVIRVAAAAARYRVPVTVRGAGTGNYGQCIPVQGGIVLDMSALTAIEWQK